ncbi:MAG: hypothetical protein GY903_30575 [Fuerstiella sp.]|nr:hypothetical protein [Fuerstiella sp.]MCP4858837.1 hypothetical protein [Fuerstiella sp.]
MSPSIPRISLVVCLVLAWIPAAVTAELPKFFNAADPISQVCPRPMKGDFRRPDQVGLTASEMTFANASGQQLRAWFFPGRDVQQSILSCMGNAQRFCLPSERQAVPGLTPQNCDLMGTR